MAMSKLDNYDFKVMFSLGRMQVVIIDLKVEHNFIEEEVINLEEHLDTLDLQEVNLDIIGQQVDLVVMSMVINLVPFNYLDSPIVNYQDSSKVNHLGNLQEVNCQDKVINFRLYLHNLYSNNFKVDLDNLKDYFTQFKQNLDILINQVFNQEVDLVVN